MDPRSMEPRHVGSGRTTVFSTDLTKDACFRSERVKLWAFGHTHVNCDFMAERESAGPLRLLANQRGYYKAQSLGFDGEKVVEMV